jgi:tRNA (cytidine(34)-2'-O)-methyltransferase|tara:strand:- start:175 stop:639 length:465 start_codon:yes stop_codon:yes gene_type:complete
MLNIVLYQPEIPPNTGNIIRLCANTGTDLHLIHPLGFEMTKKSLRRASLDYEEFARVLEHNNLKELQQFFPNKKYYAVSTKGDTPLYKTRFNEGDVLLFGNETKGLPETALSSKDCLGVIRIPMAKDSRSINLSNAVAIVLFEALRQLNCPGMT